MSATQSDSPDVAVNIVTIGHSVAENALHDPQHQSTATTQTNDIASLLPSDNNIEGQDPFDEVDAYTNNASTRPPSTSSPPPPSQQPSPAWQTNYVSIRSADLFRAALTGDWAVVKDIAKEDPTWLVTGITKGGETVLHIAAAAKHLRVVQEVIGIDSKSLVYINKDGSTPFCFAAVSGVVKIAEAMVQRNKELPNIRTHQGTTPLLMAVLLGLEDMVRYLLEVTDDNILTDQDRIEILTTSIDTHMFDVALQVLKKKLDLAFLRDSKGATALHALARLPLKQGGYRPSLWTMITGRWRSSINNGGNLEPPGVIELTEILWRQIIQQNKEDISASIRLPWQLLFFATWLGKVEFLTVLIQFYPDLLWKVDDNGYSIFHIAVIGRQPEIFKLIHEIGAMKDLIATYKDNCRNNMLHLVSKLPPQDRLNCIPGAALQLQRELQWYEAVKHIVRSDYAEAENVDFQTPQSLFSKEHEELRKQGEEWMKKTAESCALVAALVATMVFSTAYQLPGGLNSDKGSPILVKTTSFMFYAMSNAVSLFTSTASILMFLSILTSRYAERDFLESLPVKLMIGLVLLLI